MTLAFNRAVAIELQIHYAQFEDACDMRDEQKDLLKEITPHENSLLYRIKYIAEEVAKKNEKPPQPKVYFAQSSGGPIKIGYTEGSLKARSSALQIGNHERIEMRAAIHGAGLATESELHERFQQDRLKGEWFKSSPELLEIMESHPASENPPKQPCQCQICNRLNKSLT